MLGKRTLTRTQNTLLIFLFLGDICASYAGLTFAYLARFKTPIASVARDAVVSFELYQPLIWLGTLFLITSYAYLRVYDARLLLRPHRSFSLLLKGTVFWFLAFLSASLVFQFQPAISRLFVALACLTTLSTILVWRYVFYIWLSRGSWRQKLTQRVMLIGWSSEADELIEAIDGDENHPYEIVGVLNTPGTESVNRRFTEDRILGEIDALDAILIRHQIDIAVIADLDLPKAQMVEIAQVCERRYVSFNVIPSFFQIFISNLRMRTISGVPILGYSEPELNSAFNQLLKRTVDIIGATVGLLGAFPIILFVAWRIRKEDPGPVFFFQERLGQDGKPFHMIKLRSMRIGADKMDHLNQSTLREDPRVLKIGAFIRKWNLDELPQFWNVLIGEMSLVGPRPERTYHAVRLAEEIPNYTSRHISKPGMTGWAQVNGLRGESDLTMRVKYDLYYIENWSIWFDIQIMLLTFVRRDNAY